MFVSHKQCEAILADRRVRALKFTGSTRAGIEVGILAARNVKKCMLELGGNDPFLVLKDANIEQAVNTAYTSRLANSGQACINAKRFIVTAPVYDEFKERLIEKIKADTVIGDPMDPSVNLGPLASQGQYDLL
jgi:succinate-semialdehyde dehydrogenase / glutarate-semialdehyde dehydrogenase